MKDKKKLMEKILRSLIPKDKKGQIVNTISGTVLSLLVMIFIIFAVIFGIAVLNPGGFFTAGTPESYAIGNLSTNLTYGVGQFGIQIPNVFKILAVVLVLAGIVLLVLYIARMRQVGGGGGVGL